MPTTGKTAALLQTGIQFHANISKLKGKPQREWRDDIEEQHGSTLQDPSHRKMNSKEWQQTQR